MATGGWRMRTSEGEGVRRLGRGKVDAARKLAAAARGHWRRPRDGS